MLLEQRPLKSIRPYPNNPRLTESAVDAVAASIRQFGFRQPIVVDADDVIIVGHVRFEAAQKLRLPEVPVHVARDLSPEQIRAYRLADNKTGELADWDWEKLRLEIDGLAAADVDPTQLGFSLDELAKVLNPGVSDGLIDADAAPPVPDEATTRRGDLWVLGEHRLLCGDSALAADVDRLLAGESVQLVHTDPPYGVAVEPRGDAPSGNKLRAKDRPLLNDALTPAAFAKKLNAWFHNLGRVLEPGRAFYAWGGYANFTSYPAPLLRAGLYFSQALVWVKNQPVLTRQDFHTQHEWCFYGWRDGAAHEFFGPRNLSDVWEVKKVPGVEMVHLTQKPVELALRAIEYSSRPKETVLDLFGGSGTTLIAAEQTGRRARLVELDPLYCDVIVRRWEQFTGRRATLAKPEGTADADTSHRPTLARNRRAKAAHDRPRASRSRHGKSSAR